MTTDERLTRIERAISSLARNMANRGPLRGPHIREVKEISMEIEAQDRTIATEQRREELRSELADLEAA